MDLDGIKRRRTAYRSPRLSVAVRTVDVPPAIPVRQPRPLAFDAVVINDVTITKKVTATSSEITEVIHRQVVPLPASAEEREPVSQPEVPQQPVRAKAKRRLKPRFMYAAAAVVVAVGALLAYQAFMANTAVEIQVKKLQAANASGDSSSSTSLPSDEKPADPNYKQNYKVAPLLPRLLTIQKIGVSARVLQVGVDKDNRMDVPKTAYDVAWYNGSSRPGENGAMVIDGHVQGVGGGAVFSKLHTLVAGDTLTVDRGDGKQYVYKVVSTETIPVDQVDMGKLLVSADTAVPGLNLITCAGTYDQQSDQFDSRTIVYTLQQ